MNKFILMAATAIILTSCAEFSGHQQTASAHVHHSHSPIGWNAWAQWIEKRRSTADEQGHGPDVGSDEWAHSVDRQLGISEGGHGPDIKSFEWRHAVELKLGLHVH